MLYVTTRSREATSSVRAPITRAADERGGLYVPDHLPLYTAPELRELGELPFRAAVAQVMNRFFTAGFSAASLSFLREPEFHILGHKVYVTELWNKKEGSYEGTRRQMLSQMGCYLDNPVGWPCVAADIAVLFGLYGCLRRTTGEQRPMILAGADFSFGPAAAYAKAMGLPIEGILSVSRENDGVWDLMHRGEARADRLPGSLERVIALRLGTGAARKFARAREEKKNYSLASEQREMLSKDFFEDVIGEGRCSDLIARTYGNTGYLLSPPSASIYGGVMDYRAMMGKAGPVILLAEDSPVRWGRQVLAALSIPEGCIAEQIAALEKTGKES